jgi:hemolysin III
MAHLIPFREPFSAYSHGLWLVLSVPATLILLQRSGRDSAKRLSFLIFGLSLSACYLSSMLYHGVRLEKSGIELFDRLDHVGIHLLIAGSYTPLAWNLMQGRWRWGTLIAVWSTTLISSGLLLASVRLSLPMATCEYLALGWAGVLCYFQVSRVVSHKALRPLVAGGICYSVGAVLNLMRWPVLWPGVFSSHDVFHLWVMAGSLAHVWFMYSAVVPVTATTEPEPGSRTLTARDSHERRSLRDLFRTLPRSGRILG